MPTESPDLFAAIVGAENRIRGQVLKTPALHSPHLSRLSGGRVFLKLENLQWTGSFKIRGAMNKILGLSDLQKEQGVVTASTGNHALAVAWALRRAGCRGTVVLPLRVSPSKLEELELSGVSLVRHGRDSAETEKWARQLARERGRIYVSPYNDFEIIAGQGTIGLELARQVPDLEVLFATVGGGGLMSGVGTALKSLFPAVELVGCWPRNSPVLYESLRAGRILEMESAPTLSDGSAGGVEPDTVTFEFCRQLLDESVLVEEEEIQQAIRLILEKHRLVVEGAAGVAVAAFLQQIERYRGRTVVLLLCGGNISLKDLKTCL